VHLKVRCVNVTMHIVLIPPCCTYGDVLSVTALANFLRTLYSTVAIFINDEQQNVAQYYLDFFKACPISIINRSQTIQMVEAGAHVCNTHTGTWTQDLHNYLFYEYCKDKTVYFCDSNPLYTYHKIPVEYRCEPNKRLPLSTTETNSIVYYKMVGLNNSVRMNYFSYIRDHAAEERTRSDVFSRYGLQKGDKYNIVNTIGSQGDFIDIERIKVQITNGYPCIDINYLVKFPGWLCGLVENAEVLYLTEGCNTNFIYYCQYKGIIRKVPTYFLIWARNRRWEA